nr:TolB domain-containing protein [Neobacillus sp. Marseille-Q6967]
MKKSILLLMIFLLLIPRFSHAESVDEKVSAAFIRDGFVWTKINGKEEKITKEPADYHYPPQWSFDGQWILYQKVPKEKINQNIETKNEVWVYHLASKKHKRITYDGRNPKWSPIENVVAFQSGGVLNVSNLEKFYNIALGVDDFEWFPDGQSFIASSSASLHPDGWSNPKLYKIHLPKNLEKVKSLTENVENFYTIPSELKKGNESLLAINATDFNFSPDGKWISFIVSPTASWSMDSNMVCVLSADGKTFEEIDEIILHLDDPKWAPSKNILGYIAGGGRIVLGFKDKDLKITEMPAFQSQNLTPENFAEMGFTWKDNNTLIVSRVPESEWSNNAEDRPNPALFLIKIGDPKQPQLSHPPADFGDYNPHFIASHLTWLRKKDIADSKVDLWIADADGKNAEVWIKDIEGYAFYVK